MHRKIGQKNQRITKSKQKKRREDKNPFSVEKLYYNIQQDCYYCPMGQKMSRVGEKKRLTKIYQKSGQLCL